jgi:energy-coupling factor transporter ATP-binding protein EcfA2
VASQRLKRKPVLRASNLSVAPPGDPSRAIVRDFSLSIGPGEWVAITGENGSGKSTLVLALAGLRPTRAGSLHLMGAPFQTGDPSGARSEVGVVLQEPESQLLQPTVAEELAFSARNRGIGEAEIDQRVARRSGVLGLGSELDRDPHVLSAGRQQLVLIAAALVAEPRLLILDEAGAHLDSANRALVIDLLREEQRRGLAILWVTQERDELEAADRVVSLAPVRADRVERGVASAAHPIPHADRLLRIRVAPGSGEPGLRIDTPEPLEIGIGTTGIVAVEGPNGSGKSVLLAAAAGVIRLPQIEVSWLRPTEQPPILAAQYPELQLFEELAVNEVVFGAVRRGVPREEARARASRLIAELGFEPDVFWSRRSFDLSAGEKRVLQIAGTLISPSPLWILDEPTAGLDPSTRRRLGRIVLELSKEGALLVATQDREWVAEVSARHISLASRTKGQMASNGQKTD